MRRAVAAAVKDARDAGRVRPWDEPGVALAEGLASALDAAYEVSDPMLIMKLTGELRVSLSGLPLRGELAAPAGEVVSGGSSGDRAGAAWDQLVRAAAH